MFKEKGLTEAQKNEVLELVGEELSARLYEAAKPPQPSVRDKVFDFAFFALSDATNKVRGFLP